MRSLALLCVVLLAAYPATARPAPNDTEQGAFGPCAGPARVTCVVDGDTFWYRGIKFRLADVNAPEVSQPRCPGEAALGARAARRLAELLNRRGFTLVALGRDEDRYGRKLRIVTRGGVSLGSQLEREGLAERWTGRRGTWCAG